MAEAGYPNQRLIDRLDALVSRYGKAEVEAVREVVGAVMSTMSGDLTAAEAALLNEFEELGRIVAAAREEIAALRVDDLTQSHIPAATDELEAVVKHTEQATNTIMDACDQINNVSSKVPAEVSNVLTEATTAIFEACSFQDLTGQRINKVVKALKAIEERVNHIVANFGERASEQAAASPPRPPVEEPAGEAKLLNGPQMPGAGVSQTAIDSLFD